MNPSPDIVTKTQKWFSLFILPVLILAVSCEEPEREIVKNWFVIYQTSPDRVIMYGDSIDVALNVIYGYDNKSGAKVRFEILEGGGTLSKTETVTDVNGKATTIWKPGKLSSGPVLRASAYNELDELVASRDLNAFSFIPDDWVKVTTGIDPIVTDIHDMACDTEAGITLMVSNGKIYREGERYYWWSPVDDPLLNGAQKIEADGNGTMYVLTDSYFEKQKLVRSTDHGKTWTQCTDPYGTPAKSDYNFEICNDNSIWAYSYGVPVRFSADGGMTWQSTRDSLIAWSQADVFRLTNGDLLFYGYGCDLNISKDNGQTWNKITTPPSTIGLFVTPEDKIVISALGVGFMIYTSDDYCQSFKYVKAYQTQEVFLTGNFVFRWKDKYYISIPAYGVVETKDFKNMELLLNFDQYDTFIDHNGILVSKGKDYKSAYYLKRSGL